MYNIVCYIKVVPAGSQKGARKGENILTKAAAWPCCDKEKNPAHHKKTLSNPIGGFKIFL